MDEYKKPKQHKINETNHLIFRMYAITRKLSKPKLEIIGQ
jgi:hypothetical protein